MRRRSLMPRWGLTGQVTEHRRIEEQILTWGPGMASETSMNLWKLYSAILCMQTREQACWEEGPWLHQIIGDL